MIDVPLSQSLSARRLWSGYVKSRFLSLDLQDRADADGLSESLALFCEQHTLVPDRSLSLLMARSLCRTGDREAAGRVLRSDRAHCTHIDSWLDALSAEYPFPELYALFASRILHPLRLSTIPGEQTWVLDLDKIQLAESDRHEIILLQTLRVLIEKVSNVWKKSDGEGACVIKGLPRLASFIHSDTAPAPRRMLDYLHEVLCRCGKQNGWSSIPSILLFDL